MKKVLIITSSGGGGLLQSAIAIEQEEKQKDPKVKIVKKDLLRDLVPVIGFFGMHFYNWTQRNGKVKLQNWFSRLNLKADYMFFPFVFFKIFKILCEQKITSVYDNQPVATSAILKAIRLYNKLNKKKVMLEKVIVDLPTKSLKQILKSIKRLSVQDKKLLKMRTVEPLFEGEENEKEYWEKHCGLGMDQITYKKYTIRKVFKRFQNKKKPKRDFFILLKMEKSKLLIECLNIQKIEHKLNKFVIRKEEKLIVILLGSKPAIEAVVQYTKSFIEIAKNKKEKYKIFIYLEKERNELFKRVCNIILEEPNFPNNLKIIPMGFQSEDVIAALFHRSDITITRSGGHTIMELMAVAKGEKWIHSETKDPDQGMVFWEVGNAMYLCKKMDGKIVMPNLIKEFI